MDTHIRPLIKENRISNLVDCLSCIDRFSYDRPKQLECVLSLYPNVKKNDPLHKEKSVFRGMVIPSLRHLGLIVGFGDFIRVSANGKLIVASRELEANMHGKVLRAVFWELDSIAFGFLVSIHELAPKNSQEFVELMVKNMEGFSDKQKKERIQRWLRMLAQVELILYDPPKLEVRDERHRETSADLSYRDSQRFNKLFLESYAELKSISTGVVDIAELRKVVCLSYLRNHERIVTENMFDEMLRAMPFETDHYLISLGRPMGAGEKLLEYKGNHYRTIFIDFRLKEIAN